MLRGTILALLAAIVCWAPRTPVSATAAINLNAPLPANGASPPVGAIVVPFEYFRQHIYVTVTVNDRPGMVFMLDSGASKNILNLRAARQLGIQSRKLKQEKNVGFGAERIYVAPETRVHAEINSVPVARVMSVMDLSHFERHSSHLLDGILGYPFLQRFVVKLDFHNNLLTLLPLGPYLYRGPGVRIGILERKNFAVVPITIGSSRYARHSINVVIDTGSNVTLMMYERFVRGLDLQDSLAHAMPARAYGLNGYYDVAQGSIHSIQVGVATAHRVPVDYIDPDEEVHLAHNIQGEIGNGILQGFMVVVFDVPHRQMVFLPKQLPLQSGTVRTVTIGP